MKTINTTIQLSSDEALLLQQISECGEDDIAGLTRGLKMSRHYIFELLGRLKTKGLVTIRTTYDDTWIRVNARGRQLVRYMWPEFAQMYRGV